MSQVDAFLSMVFKSPSQLKVVVICNNCKLHIKTRYHCADCVDFYLCAQCYHRIGHPHKMEKLGLELVERAFLSDQLFGQQARTSQIQHYIKALIHACLCHNPNCALPDCGKMKPMYMHTRACKVGVKGGCITCTQLIGLYCFHAKLCRAAKCGLPYCANIKRKIELHVEQLASVLAGTPAAC